jgi:hypothetical protein
MGSFAYSLHVKCDDADRVAQAIRQLLAGEWRPSDQPPDEKLRRRGQASNRRAFFISTPVYGWVSVLDSDLAGAMSLAGLLAEQLDAMTLLCLVNDSDSWGYVLSRGDGLVDEFDSSGAGGVPDAMSDADLAQMGQSIEQLQAKLTDGSLMKSIAALNDEMLAQAPPEMQELHRRMQAGQASREEIASYQAWAAAESPKYTQRIQQLVGDMFQLPSLSQPAKAVRSKKRKRKKNKAQRAAADERLDQLRPLLVARVTDEQIEEVLDEQAVFAEETLAKFLPLLGIPSFYAYLDYDHKDEGSDPELAAHGIQFAHHLMFKANSGPTAPQEPRPPD